MKTAIPVESPKGMDSEINDHFGMTEYFAIFEIESEEVSSFGIVKIEQSFGLTKKPSRFLKEQDVKMVLSGYIGPHMLEDLLNSGIRVFKGAVGSVEDAIEDYKAGMLTEVHSLEEMKG